MEADSKSSLKSVMTTLSSTKATKSFTIQPSKMSHFKYLGLRAVEIIPSLAEG